MPILESAENTDARGSIFNDIGGDQVIHNISYNTNNSDPLALLNPVPDAVYDSIMAVSGCMAGTRQEVIGYIVKWIEGRSNQPMCWLHGAAGSGKSAISKTIAELCAGANRLGASFFFLRGAGRRSRITDFIPTLSYHLAFSVPAARSYIQNILLNDHHIGHRSLERQLRKLIIEPIQSVATEILPMVIIIDALDECDDKQMIADFVEIVARILRDGQCPLRFLFTSRVEDHIQKKFSTSPALDTTYHLSLQKFDANGDILTFFRSRFSTIYQENRWVMRNVPLPWPSERVLIELVRKSSRSFIFAFTLVNFVKDGSDLPHRKLEVALQSHAGLDPLYTQVLRSTPRSAHFIRTFETIMTVKEQLSIADVAYLLQIDTGDVIHALLGVQSILIVPEDDESPIRPFHTSLREFLTTITRSNDLFINPSVRHLSIASDCLAVMVVRNGEDTFEHTRLRWACRSWSDHLLYAIQGAGDNLLFSRRDFDDFMNKLIAFASQSFDLWVDSVIFEVSIRRTLKTLDSVVSELEKLDQHSSRLQTTIKNIKAFTELNEQSFRTDNVLELVHSHYYVPPYVVPYHLDSPQLANTIRDWVCVLYYYALIMHIAPYHSDRGNLDQLHHRTYFNLTKEYKTLSNMAVYLFNNTTVHLFLDQVWDLVAG